VTEILTGNYEVNEEIDC